MMTYLPIVEVDRYFAKNLRFHTVTLADEHEPHVFKHLDELIAFLSNRDLHEFILCTQFHSLIVTNISPKGTIQHYAQPRDPPASPPDAS